MSIDMATLVKRLRKAREESAESVEAVMGEREPDVVVREERPARAVARPAAAPEEDEEDEEEGGEEGERVGLTPEPVEGGTYSWEESDEELEGEEREQEDVDIRYPLIPAEPEEGETVYAWARIRYDPEAEETVYRVHEPQLEKRHRAVLDEVEDRLKERIDVDFGELKREEAKEYLEEQIREILRGRGFGLSPEAQDMIEYYAYRNFVGLGKIEPLMNDKYVEDISCDGVDVPVYVYHRNPQVGSVRTDVVFEDEEELDGFVRKLAQRCGRSVSMAEPLVDGSLPDGSRVQATLGTDIARRGSNFTIRRFTENPLTPVDIMNFGTLDAKMMAYLWLAIENGKSVLVAGPTASGKTTLLNALSLFIPPELKIVSIEDTPELRLPHPNWVPEVARTGFGFGESETGAVTLDDLLKESLRQRPDYIIVGEVRGEEAYVLFQQIATGHPGMSTIHASSLEKVMDRLTTRPIDLPPSLVENLDIIVFIKRVRRRGEYVRRVDAVYELEGFDVETEEPRVNKLFDWDAKQDVFRNPSGSSIMADIAEDRGVDPHVLQEEVERREDILAWMKQQEVTYYEDVGQVTSQYYRNPDRLMERVERELDQLGA